MHFYYYYLNVWINLGSYILGWVTLALFRAPVEDKSIEFGSNRN